MGGEMLEAVRTGKPNISQHQISFANIKDITEEFISPRPTLFACLVEKQPHSLYQLAKLLKRDYANVYKDVRSLVAMGVIKLEKDGEITASRKSFNALRPGQNLTHNILSPTPSHQIIDTAGTTGSSLLYLRQANLIIVPFRPHYPDCQEQRQGIREIKDIIKKTNRGILLPPLPDKPALYGKILSG
ncbi:5957_t:CDS:2, partial [Ambispora gerdemannii]